MLGFSCAGELFACFFANTYVCVLAYMYNRNVYVFVGASASNRLHWHNQLPVSSLLLLKIYEGGIWLLHQTQIRVLVCFRFVSFVRSFVHSCLPLQCNLHAECECQWEFMRISVSCWSFVSCIFIRAPVRPFSCCQSLWSALLTNYVASLVEGRCVCCGH